MPMYYLTLGHTPSLSLLEQEAVGLTPRQLSAQLTASPSQDPLSRVEQLGGTTRLLEEIQPTTPDSFLSDLKSLISADTAKNIAFTNYSPHPVATQDLRQLKDSLTRSVRFLSFETSGHSLVALRKQHVSEYSLLQDEGNLILTKTIWIQDADSWSFRDRRRPYQDIKRGMLPPKIARIMVNLAACGQAGTLLDPFCGTGTILLEALLLNNVVIGSDNDPAAIKGSKANIEWLADKYELPKPMYQLYPLDSTHLGEEIAHVDYVVTEPYLGPLLESRSLPPQDKLKNISRGLDKLYRGTLNSITRLLARKGRVVIVIPEFHAYGQVFSTLTVDSTDRLGYNTLSQTPYSQPGAVVTRLITVLERN